MDKDEKKDTSKRISIKDLGDATLTGSNTKTESYLAKPAKLNSSLFNSTSRLEPIPSPIKPLSLRMDNRTRAEINEDYEKRLASIKVEDVNRLIGKLSSIEKKLEDDDDSNYKLFQANRDALTILLRYKEDFERHTSEMEQRLRYKQREVNIEKRADWAEKFRLFFFRTLGAALLVITLFTVGYIEHNYEWARLPLSAYLKPSIDRSTVSIAPLQLRSNLTPAQPAQLEYSSDISGDPKVADKLLVPIALPTPEQSN